MDTILDMVKVMSFALEEGKVAVHCHAGLGRTGKRVFFGNNYLDQQSFFKRKICKSGQIQNCFSGLQTLCFIGSIAALCENNSE